MSKHLEHLVRHGLIHLGKEKPATTLGIILGWTAAATAGASLLPVVAVAAAGAAVGSALDHMAKEHR